MEMKRQEEKGTEIKLMRVISVFDATHINQRNGVADATHNGYGDERTRLFICSANP